MNPRKTLDGKPKNNSQIAQHRAPNQNSSSIRVLLFEQIEQDVNDVIHHDLPYQNKIVKVYLFGSYAKKEASAKSDVDLHIVSDGSMSLSELIDFQNRLKEALGKEVDAVGSSIISEPSPFVKNIQKEEILLYEK